MKKICSDCRIEKSLEMYHIDSRKLDGHKNSCKECRIKYSKTRREKDEVRERERMLARKWIRENKERKKEYDKQYLSKEENRVKRRKYFREKEQNNPIIKLKKRVSSAIWLALTRQSKSKTNPTWSKLPYSAEELKAHLEKQFDKNMNWQNYGSYWWIDHIIPQSKLIYDSMEHPNFLICWSLENLQPLEKHENMSKGAK